MDVTEERQTDKLRRDFGGVFLTALEDSNTVEIILNADGQLWQERLGEEMRVIGRMDKTQAEAAIRTVAACLKTTITRDNPLLEGELPLDGSRIAAQLPPVVVSPTFSVRKKASAIYTLDQYVETGIMTPEQKAILCSAIKCHQNILVIGGTGGGKTTLCNALILELTQQYPHERVIIIEDTNELQCAALNCVQYHTSRDVTMTGLVRTALRMRPDRILVGEVRGPEALDLLMAWNTGHEGGLATVHANNATAGLARLLMLISMHKECPRDIEPLIGEVVQVIVHIARHERGGRLVKEILRVNGFDKYKGYLTERVENIKRE